MLTRGYFNAEEFGDMRTDCMFVPFGDTSGFVACRFAGRIIGMAGVAGIVAIEDINSSELENGKFAGLQLLSVSANVSAENPGPYDKRQRPSFFTHP